MRASLLSLGLVLVGCAADADPAPDPSEPGAPVMEAPGQAASSPAGASTPSDDDDTTPAAPAQTPVGSDLPWAPRPVFISSTFRDMQSDMSQLIMRRIAGTTGA